MEPLDHATLLENLFSLFEDDTEELFVNGCRGCFLKTSTEHSRKLESPFLENHAMIKAMQMFALKNSTRLDQGMPFAGGESFFSQGEQSHFFRWSLAIPPMATPDPLISIRRHNFQRLTLSDFDGGTPLQALLNQQKVLPSILIAGPTGSGKSSLLMSILKKYFMEKRILILENIPELPILGEAWMRLCAIKPAIDQAQESTLNTALHAGLRLRPDAIVVSEMRSDESDVFAQALLTGHQQVFSTLHLSSLHLLHERMEQMIRLPGLQACLEQANPLLILMGRGHPKKIAAVHYWSEI